MSPASQPGRGEYASGPAPLAARRSVITTAELREPALRLQGLSKTFPGVRALKNVDLVVKSGSVHALLGHNGCGKSTLVKALAGFHAPDVGCEAHVSGEPLELGSSTDAERLGIRFVHQDLGLVLELGAVDNVGLVCGYRSGRGGRIRWADQAAVTADLLRRFGITIDPRTPLSAVSPVGRTAVALVRAVAGCEPGKGLLVLDEPTASLPAREVDELFALIREIRDTGTAVMLISHRLDEVMAIADYATVMRNGEVVWDGPTDDMTIGAFARLIAHVEGTDTLDLGPRRAEDGALDDTDVLLRVDAISGRYLRNVCLRVRKGEILGVAGLLGSGREELPYIVAGAGDPCVTGSFTMDGRTLEQLNIATARELGIALVPADRGGEGIISEFTVRENVTMAALPGLRKERGGVGFVSPARERSFARSWLGSVSADADAVEKPITVLSGGNQQKAVLARWLSVAPRLLAISEPTAGIDIGARAALYEEFRARADRGLTLLVSSSDAEDLVAVCDRVVVLRDGVIVTELVGDQITKANIVTAMEGAHHEQ